MTIAKRLDTPFNVTGTCRNCAYLEYSKIKGYRACTNIRSPMYARPTSRYDGCAEMQPRKERL